MDDELRTDRPTRVLATACHHAARVGATRALEAAGLEVVGEFVIAAAAVAAARAHQADVCLVDARLPDGAAAIAALAALEPAPRVIVLGGRPAIDDLFAATDAGASGYLLEDVTGDRLALAVADVAAGHAAVAPALVADLVDVVRAVRGRATPPGLTNREHEVLALLALGMATKQVAQRLGLSPTTIRRHASTAVRKLGARDRRGAIAGLAGVQGCERR